MGKDDAYLNSLYREYYTVVFQYCLAMLEGDECDASDCTQLVFEVASQNLNILKTHINVIGWLKKTAKFRVKRVLRKRGIRTSREIPILDASERYLESLQYIDDYEKKLVDEIDVEVAKAAVLGKLTPDEYSLYSMRFIDKSTIKIIAVTLSMSESATRMRLVRLESKIRDMVRVYMNEK